VRIKARSTSIHWLVRCGILPADTLLLYDDDCLEWHSGFGSFALVLYSLVRSAKPDVIVEVGSAYGKSTCFIAAALQRNLKGKLFSIDPHEKTEWNDGDEAVDTYQIVSKRITELHLNPYVDILRSYSKQVYQSWNQPIDFLLLDGAHDYESVKADFYGFLPNLRPGSMVIFHDTMWEYQRDSHWYRPDQGVPRVVQELMDEGFPVVTLREGWGLSILQNSLGGFCLMPQHNIKTRSASQ
jgi:predicted O-methyltransferase YrrM